MNQQNAPDPRNSPEQQNTPDRQDTASPEHIYNTGWGAPVAGETAGWGNEPAGGPAKSGTRPWPLKKGLIVGGVAVVLAAGTAAGVYSASSSSATESTAAGNLVPGQGGTGHGGTGQGGTGQGGTGLLGQGGGFAPDGTTRGSGAAGISASVHGEYVVLRNQQYVTVSDQLGTVTEVSANSLTVKSADGFTRTYAVGDNVLVAQMQALRQRGDSATGTLSMSDVGSGASVRVVALKDSAGYTAESIQLVTTGSTTTN